MAFKPQIEILVEIYDKNIHSSCGSATLQRSVPTFKFHGTYWLGANLHGPALRVLQQAPPWIRNPRHQGQYSGKLNFLDNFRIYSNIFFPQRIYIFPSRIYIFSKIPTAKNREGFSLISPLNTMKHFSPINHIPNRFSKSDINMIYYNL